jgi:Na+/H+-dicarboxylate symporter
MPFRITGDCRRTRSSTDLIGAVADAGGLDGPAEAATPWQHNRRGDALSMVDLGQMLSMKTRLLVAVTASFTLAVLLSLTSHYWIPLPPMVVGFARWVGVATLAAYALYKRSLTTWIFVAMLVGAALGQDWPAVAVKLRVLSLIFLRLIKTIIAPLLFATLVSGIAGHSDLKKVGRLGIRAMIYFEGVTTLALVIGLAAINLSKAGVGVPVSRSSPENLALQQLTPSETILHIFPENFAKSVAEGQVLQVVVFSILFGIGLAMVREERRRPLLNLTDSLAETMFKFTNIVMYFAPVGVGAAIAYTVGSTGMGILVNLAKLLLTLYLALLVFILGVLLPISLLAGVPVRRFIAAVAEPVSIAFGTASSEAALPRAMEAMEGLGVPREVVAFVMPTGYSFNLDGSTLYLSLASIFAAQAAGIHLSPGQQVVMMLTLMLTSKGVAGVSRASLVVLLGTIGSFGLPVEPVFILLGIDQLMDMGRTAVNVLGNCLATVVVARWEGDFPSAGTSSPALAVTSARGSPD